MQTDNLDIVYCCKNSLNNEELRYSLRSLKNMPHRNVWIYGGCPNWVRNVRHVPMSQRDTKWWNTANMLKEIAENKELTKNFIWFNDDFFVLRPCNKIEYWRDGTLEERVLSAINRTGQRSRYGRHLEVAENILMRENRPARNFELHLPIIFNQRRLATVCRKYADTPIRRSIYCNEYKITGKPHKDVKVENRFEGIPQNAMFFSTSDNSFAAGEAGRQIRRLFPDKCEYELTTYGLSFVASPGFKRH